MSSLLHRLWAAAYQAAFAAAALPAVAWAQQQSAPAPLDNPTAPDAGAVTQPIWPWIVAALVLLALAWWVMTYRRRGRLPR